MFCVSNATQADAVSTLPAILTDNLRGAAAAATSASAAAAAAAVVPANPHEYALHLVVAQSAYSNLCRSCDWHASLSRLQWFNAYHGRVWERLRSQAVACSWQR